MPAFALFPLLAAVGISGLGAIVLLRDVHGRLNRVFAFYCLLAASSIFTEFLQFQAETVKRALFWLRIGSFWPFLPASLFHLALASAAQGRPLRKKWRLAVTYGAALILSVAFFLRNLNIGSVRRESWGWALVRSGGAFPVLAALILLAMALGAVILTFRAFLKTKDSQEKKRTLILTFGISLPLLTALLSESLTRSMGSAFPSLNFLGILLGASVIAYGIRKYSLFPLSPRTAAENILATMADGLLLVDLDGRILGVNPAALRLTGFKERELVGQFVEILLEEADRPKFSKKAYAGMVAARSVVGFELRFQTRSGRRIPVSLSASVVKDSSGRDQGVVCVFRDLTERKATEDELRAFRDHLEELVGDRTAELALANEALQGEIVERRKAELALEESRSRLMTLLQAIPDIVYFKDAAGRNVVVNRAFERMVGRLQEDIVGRPDDELLPPILAVQCRRSDEETLRSGQTLRFVESFGGEGGSAIFFESIKAPILDESGKAVALVGVSRDISERKRAEEALKESEERFRSIFENATVGLYRTTPEGRVLMANPTLIRMLGYSSFEEMAEARNLEVDGFEPSYPRAIFRQRIEAEGEVRGLEASWKRRDGTTIYVRESARVVRDEQGRVLYYEGTVEDITERERAIEALRRSEEQFRLLAENAKDVIYRVELQPSRRTTYISPSVIRILGYTPEDYYADPDLILKSVHPEDRSILEAAFGEKTSPDQPVIFRCLRRDGQTVWMEHHVKPISDPGGRLLALEAIARDITERKRDEEALKASLQEKEVLLKEIHHRVKNNMQVISSLLSLQAAHLTDEGAREMFRESQNRIRSMAFIHDRLYRTRDFSKLDFAEYLQNLLAHLQRTYNIDPARVATGLQAEAVFLDINTAIPCGLIVNELVSNAFKHAFPEGRRGNVRVGLRRVAEDRVEFTVKDDGVGFPPGLDFQKTESLGLQLVNLLAGQLEAEVELSREEGTSFRIAFSEMKYRKSL